MGNNPLIVNSHKMAPIIPQLSQPEAIPGQLNLYLEWGGTGLVAQDDFNCVWPVVVVIQRGGAFL
jgi:hypothetical protein